MRRHEEFERRRRSAKLELLSKSLFIQIFFIVTGFLISPVTFVQGIIDNFLLVAGIIAALLVGKWIAASVVGRVFGYSRDEQLMVWSLTLAQVARHTRRDFGCARYTGRGRSAFT